MARWAWRTCACSLVGCARRPPPRCCAWTCHGAHAVLYQNCHSFLHTPPAQTRAVLCTRTATLTSGVAVRSCALCSAGGMALADGLHLGEGAFPVRELVLGGGGGGGGAELRVREAAPACLDLRHKGIGPSSP